MKKANIAVLVSGGGTNLQALLDAQAAGKLPHGEIALVVASRSDAYALTRAAEGGIPSEVVRRKDFEDQATYEDALASLMRENKIDLIEMCIRDSPCVDCSYFFLPPVIVSYLRAACKISLQLACPMLPREAARQSPLLLPAE